MPMIDVHAAKGTSRRLMLVELVDTYLAQHDVQPVTIDVRADDPVLVRGHSRHRAPAARPEYPSGIT